MQIAKDHVLAGRYAEALAALGRIKEEAEPPGNPAGHRVLQGPVRPPSWRWAGAGKIADAGQMMKAFADANPKSYHYFEASEIVGDLLVAIRQYAAATEYYARLEKAPWPDYKMRAGVASGRALLAQGKTDEAWRLRQGDRHRGRRAMRPSGNAWPPPSERPPSWSRSKKPDEAIKLIEEVLKTDRHRRQSEQVPLMARAYNVLGTAHRQAGRTKEALLAFLHVDLLYSGVPDAHAEALANLADLGTRSTRPSGPTAPAKRSKSNTRTALGRRRRE